MTVFLKPMIVCSCEKCGERLWISTQEEGRKYLVKNKKIGYFRFLYCKCGEKYLEFDLDD